MTTYRSLPREVQKANLLPTHPIREHLESVQQLTSRSRKCSINRVDIILVQRKAVGSGKYRAFNTVQANTTKHMCNLPLLNQYNKIICNGSITKSRRTCLLTIESIIGDFILNIMSLSPLQCNTNRCFDNIRTITIKWSMRVVMYYILYILVTYIIQH